MAAFELFEDITSRIPLSARQNLSEFIRSQREELLAARSEEARVRLVTEYMREIHDLQAKPARGKG